MAHQLLKHTIRIRKLQGWEVDSCGLAVNSSFPTPAHVKSVLAQEGVPDFEHTPRQITGRAVEWADQVLVMEEGHKQAIQQWFPRTRTPVELLRRYAQLPDPEIEDPITRSLEVYAQSFRQIKEAIDVIVQTHVEPTQEQGS